MFILDRACFHGAARTNFDAFGTQHEASGPQRARGQAQRPATQALHPRTVGQQLANSYAQFIQQQSTQNRQKCAEIALEASVTPEDALPHSPPQPANLSYAFLTHAPSSEMQTKGTGGPCLPTNLTV